MSECQSGPAARRFGEVTGRLHSLLPGFLQRLIPRTFIGFAMISSFTFTLDLILLWLTHEMFGVVYPLAVSVSFGAAASIAFFLNKILNFRARGDVGRQSGKYVLVLISNYVIWIVGFSSLLEALGVYYLAARILAGVAEGVYIYICSRLWVFRKRDRRELLPHGEPVPSPVV